MKTKSRRIFSGVIATALVAALAVPAMAAPDSFTDVPANAWYAQDVADVQELGIIQGKGNGLFDPNGTLTVAEAVTLAAKTGAYYKHETIPTVEGGSWYSGAVEYATAQGMMSGREFADYNANATRSEMAYLFARALPDTEYTAINSITELPDVNSGSKYSTEIFRLYNAGIVTGSDTYGTFQPTSRITRAEAAAILNRVVFSENRKTLTLEKESSSENQGQAQTWIEGQAHSEPKVGDTVIKADGTRVVLDWGISGILGAGQGVDIYTGAVVDGVTYQAGMTSWYDGWVFYKDDLTGEVHTAKEWNTLEGDLYPHGFKGDYDGEVYNIWYEYDSSDGLWYWIGPIFR